MNIALKLVSFLAALLFISSQVEGLYVSSLGTAGGNRLTRDLLSRHKGLAAGGSHDIQRRSNADNAMMDKVLQEELQYAQQLASGIITDLRSLLVDIRKDPSDPDRLLRLS